MYIVFQRALATARPTARASFGRSLATHASPSSSVADTVASQRRLWSRKEIQEVYDGPLLDLVFRAGSVHRANHDPSKVQLCTLMNIKSTSASFFPIVEGSFPTIA